MPGSRGNSAIFWEEDCKDKNISIISFELVQKYSDF